MSSKTILSAMIVSALFRSESTERPGYFLLQFSLAECFATSSDNQRYSVGDLFRQDL